MATVAFMRALEEDVSVLAQAPANRAYGRQLRQIGEAIRYSDFSGRADADRAIEEKIRELKYVLREAEGDDADAGGDAGAGAGLGAGTGMGVSPVANAGAGDPGDPARGKQVDLLTEDILRLVRDRNRELINNKKARNYSDG